ncbi:hypothetical protein PR048_000115 [Dryococelus australis]|uniref:Uncharacterized protein n=1 Tax=Dryococelus australis TaxID=614101 RepID=A0ABQ9IDQ8_9NEOP|nr:hypothetical protein PR048_000115 [Dryococelus australis]
MGLLLAAAAMMKAMLGALGVGAVALLAGKALMTGLLALMLAAIVSLKSLAGGGGKHVSYEIVSKPVVSHVDTHSHEVVHEHGHGHSSYGRSFDIATDYPAASGPPHAYLPLTAPEQPRLHPVYQAASPAAPPPPAETFHGGTMRYHDDFRPLTAPGRDLPAPNT